MLGVTQSGTLYLLLYYIFYFYRVYSCKCLIFCFKSTFCMHACKEDQCAQLRMPSLYDFNYHNINVCQNNVRYMDTQGPLGLMICNPRSSDCIRRSRRTPIRTITYNTHAGSPKQSNTPPPNILDVWYYTPVARTCLNLCVLCVIIELLVPRYPPKSTAWVIPLHIAEANLRHN